MTLGAVTLVKDTDYTVGYSNNFNAGTASVTVTGIGAYTGTKGATFTILKATPSVTWPSASAITLGQALSASTLSGGTHSVPGSFVFTTPAFVPLVTGPYTAAVTFAPTDSANYDSVGGTVEVQVEPVNISSATIASIPNQTYTGSAITPVLTVTLGADTLVKDTDYTVGYANNTNAGTASVTITGIGGYTGAKGATFTIVKATPGGITWPAASAITLGQALSSSTLSGGTQSVPGSFVFTTPSFVPLVTGPYTASVTFVPTDSANYDSVGGTVQVQVGATQPGNVTTDGTPASATGAANATSVSFAHTTGSGSDRLLLVGLSWNCGSTDRTVASATFTPTSGPPIDLTLVKKQQAGTQLRYSAIYSLLNPSPSTLGTVTITFSGAVSNGIVAGAANFAGVDQANPLGVAAGAGSPSQTTTPTVILTGLEGDELVFDAVFQGGSSSSQTLDGRQRTDPALERVLVEHACCGQHGTGGRLLGHHELDGGIQWLLGDRRGAHQTRRRDRSPISYR